MTTGPEPTGGLEDPTPPSQVEPSFRPKRSRKPPTPPPSNLEAAIAQGVFDAELKSRPQPDEIVSNLKIKEAEAAHALAEKSKDREHERRKDLVLFSSAVILGS